MPLGTREMLLVLRAKDQASRVVTDVGRSFSTLSAAQEALVRQQIQQGQTLLGLGAGFAIAGAAGLVFYGSMGNAAMEYNRQAALTLTQVDQVGVSLDTIKQIGREVAAQVPAPFEQLQSALYDIFSSMDVNVGQAQHLLGEFARAAVAGQTGVQNAGRATIAIMNAFKLPVEDVNQVMDMQFEIVKKGVITYDEFASTIGRSIPSAVRAGQSMGDLGGMIAFLTRNGLSAAMASTSAARALDLLSNPKFAANMRDIGISVTDANGNFRTMSDVMVDLRTKFAGFTPEQKSQALKNLTEGAGGTIQAMRFLNLAVGDQNNLLGELTGNVKNASGAMDAAYDIMAKQPASKLQDLKNQWHILQTELGDYVLPVFSKLVSVGSSILLWLQMLDPKIMKWIVWGGIIASAAALIGGAIVALVGGFMILSGTLELLGTSIGAVLLVSGGIILALAAVGVAVYLAIKYWDDIKTAVEIAWNFIWDKVSSVLGPLVDFIAKELQQIVDWWNAHWNEIREATKNVWEFIKFVITIAWDVISNYIQVGLATLQVLWNIAWAAIHAAVKGVWDMIKDVIQVALDIILGVISVFVDILSGHWSKAWHDIYDTVKNVLGDALQLLKDLIGDFADAAYEIGKAIVEGIIRGIKGLAGALWNTAKSVVSDAVDGVKHFLGIGSPSKLMAEVGRNMGKGLIIGINDTVYDAQRAAANLVSPAPVTATAASRGNQTAYVNIDIQNASDPEAVRKVVEEQMQQFLQAWRSM